MRHDPDTARTVGAPAPTDLDVIGDQPPFDYTALDAATRAEVQQHAHEIQRRARRLVRDLVAIGEHLVAVQHQLEPGRFRAWLAGEFHWSRSTAYRFIAVYQRFGARPNLEHLPIAPSALYLLAAPSIPDDVVDAVLRRAAGGEPIAHLDAAAAIAAIRQPARARAKTVAHPPPADTAHPGRALAGGLTSPRDQAAATAGEARASGWADELGPCPPLPSLPPDLATAGWRLQRESPQRWACEHPDLGSTAWHLDRRTAQRTPEAAIAAARACAALPESLRQAGWAIVPVPDEWLCWHPRLHPLQAATPAAAIAEALAL